MPDQRLLVDEIHHTGESSFATDGELQRHRVGRELLVDLAQHAVEVRTQAVELVDEEDARQLLTVGVHPDRTRLGFHPAYPAQHDHGPVNHANGADHFGGEVNVAGRVNQVDSMTTPIAGSGRRGDRDAALPLLLHPIELRIPFVHAAHPVDATRVVEDRLRCGRLPGVHVGKDADDAHLVDRCFGFPVHGALFLQCFNMVLEILRKILLRQRQDLFIPNWHHPAALILFINPCLNLTNGRMIFGNALRII